MQEEKKILSDSLIVFTGTVIGQLIGYVYFIVLSQTLGAKVFGQYSILISLLSTITMLSILGQNRTILRYLPIYYHGKDFKTFFFVLKILVAACGLLAIILAGIVFLFKEFIIVNLFKTTINFTSLIVLTITIPFYTILTISYDILRSIGDAKIRTFVDNIFQKLIKVGILLIAVWVFSIGLSLTYFLMLDLLGILISLGIITFYIYKKFSDTEIIGNINFNNHEFKYFMFSMIPVSIFFAVTPQIANFSLGILSNMKEAGLYNAALKIANIGLLVSVAINTNFAPFVSALKENNKIDELILLFRKITVIMNILIIYLSAVFILNGKEILFLFGNEFTNAYLVLVILFLRLVLDSFFGPVGLMITMGGYGKLTLILIIINFLSTLIFCYLFIPLWGAKGAAIALLLSTFLTQLITAIKVKEKYKIKLLHSKYLLTITGFLFLFIITIIIKYALLQHISVFFQLFLTNLILTLGFMYIIIKSYPNSFKEISEILRIKEYL